MFDTVIVTSFKMFLSVYRINLFPPFEGYWANLSKRMRAIDFCPNEIKNLLTFGLMTFNLLTFGQMTFGDFRPNDIC